MTINEVASELFKSVYGETLVKGVCIAIKELATKTNKSEQEVIEEILNEDK